MLRGEGYAFTVFTPGGSVRLMSDRTAEDYIELALETGGADRGGLGHTSRSRGRRVVESEAARSDRRRRSAKTMCLSFVLKALTPLVER